MVTCTDGGSIVSHTNWGETAVATNHAACFAFASNCTRAFFPALLASAMLSKKPDEDWIGPHRPAR